MDLTDIGAAALELISNAEARGNEELDELRDAIRDALALLEDIDADSITSLQRGVGEAIHVLEDFQ